MKKIKYSNLFILGIVIYIIFQIIRFFIGATTQTLVLENENVESKIQKKGLIIRDEKLIRADNGGYLSLYVEEDEKVKKGQEVGKIDSDDNVSKLDKEINKLNDEILKLESEIKNSNNVLNKEIQSKNLKTKQEQINVLNNKKSKLTYSIYSKFSGIISYKYDKNEDIYDIENIESISSKDIEFAKNNYTETKEDGSKVKKDDIVARVINNHSIYVAVSVTKEESKLFNISQNINLVVKNENIQAQVNNKYEYEDEDIVIFKINEQNIGIYDTRVEEFDIIYNQIEGLKIPKESIRKINKKQGVYVIDAQTKDIEFVELKGIKYQDEEFVYIDFYENELNNIKTVTIHDEIILKPNNINKNIKIR